MPGLAVSGRDFHSDKMTLHIFNPENDMALADGGSGYTAPATIRQMRDELHWLPLWWAKDDDLVWNGEDRITLSEGDELIAVMKTDGKQDIMLASADGMAICFNENDVRVMGRDAAGVRGMALDAGDSIVGAGIAAKGKQLLSVTEYGYGKRTDIEEYMRLGDDGVRRPQQRGGKGLKNYNITAKTGRIAGVAIVDDEDDVMLIENGGVLIRMAAADINVYKRDTQGVILMRVEAGNRVISVDRVDREPEETADEHEEA